MATGQAILSTCWPDRDSINGVSFLTSEIATPISPIKEQYIDTRLMYRNIFGVQSERRQYIVQLGDNLSGVQSMVTF